MKDLLLIDSNVLLDVITDDPIWGNWSSETLIKSYSEHNLAINPVIYAEVSIRFSTIEELEEILPIEFFERLPIPYEAAFLAGKCYMKYKERGGLKTNVLPDFLIGAHASVSNMKLITRDVSRYSVYFPNLKLITPK
jgi:predicted nucleic acid-binding protein